MEMTDTNILLATIFAGVAAIYALIQGISALIRRIKLCNPLTVEYIVPAQDKYLTICYGQVNREESRNSLELQAYCEDTIFLRLKANTDCIIQEYYVGFEGSGKPEVLSAHNPFIVSLTGTPPYYEYIDWHNYIHRVHHSPRLTSKGEFLVWGIRIKTNASGEYKTKLSIHMFNRKLFVKNLPLKVVESKS